jgi:hypothetical protein
MKFIKKQLLRSWNIIKHYWKSMFFEFIDEMEFTLFGKYFIGGMMGILLIFWTVIIIVFLPIILISFKYDESIGM